jgi:DNA-binding transcriptional LysR family regulator
MAHSWRQFEVFLAVARAKSFRRAAEALHLSQPSLSQHVAELERTLGVKVFDRLRRTVELTEAGRVLEDHVQRLFATLDSARKAIDDLSGLGRGSLVVGASTTPGIYVVPGMLAGFRARYPGIQLSLQIANSAVIEQRVRTSEVDLAVVGGHALRQGEVCVAAGLLDELVLIVPPSHRWARRREVWPSPPVLERLLIREEGSATRALTERSLQQAGVRFTVAMELSHTEAIKEAVAAGLGVAFVSVHAVRHEIKAKQLAAVRLKGVRLQRHFHVIHNDSRVLTHSARAFVDALGGAREDRGPVGQDSLLRRKRTIASRPAPETGLDEEHVSGGGEPGPSHGRRGAIPDRARIPRGRVAWEG